MEAISHENGMRTFECRHTFILSNELQVRASRTIEIRRLIFTWPSGRADCDQ